MTSDTKKTVIRSKLLQVKNCDGKWCHFKCVDLDTGKVFRESGKKWYLGNCIRNSGFNISRWDGGCFQHCINKLIEFETEILWEFSDGINLYPERLGVGKLKFGNWLENASDDDTENCDSGLSDND
jgi:hypothetical protein